MSELTKNRFAVMIALNQTLLETGITTLLADHPDFVNVDVLHTSDDITDRIAKTAPSLLIADYTSPGFLTLDDLRTLIQENNLNVLVISSDEDKTSILKAVQLGIKGYITKECGKREFLLAVEYTTKGEKFFCSRILDIIIDSNLSGEKIEDGNGSTLTAREQEILKMLAEGHSTQKIANALHLSPHTVQTHRKSIIRKLKITSPTQFVIYALDLGLITQKQ